LGNKEGVSLERLNPSLPTADPSNWHSASTASGYGTPTRKNTQAKEQGNQLSGISIEPKLFSPNLDGFQDYVQINYLFDQPGTVCNITIYDASGQLVRSLVRSHLCGISGTFRWDGLNQLNQVQYPGIYHIMVEIFNTSGYRKKYRHSVALVHR
jgi:flagellar hook assembly protein FlgD